MSDEAHETLTADLRAENSRLRSALRALLVANTDHNTDEPDWHGAIAGARAALGFGEGVRMERADWLALLCEIEP